MKGCVTGMTRRWREWGVLHLLKPTFTPLTNAHKRQAKVPVLLGLLAGVGSRRCVLRVEFLRSFPYFALLIRVSTEQTVVVCGSAVGVGRQPGPVAALVAGRAPPDAPVRNATEAALVGVDPGTRAWPRRATVGEVPFMPRVTRSVDDGGPAAAGQGAMADGEGPLGAPPPTAALCDGVGF